MATFKCDQRTKLTGGAQFVRLNANDAGPILTKKFELTVPVGNAAINDLFELVEIPAGACFLGGEFASEAMSSAAGDSSIQIGTAASAARYLGTTSVDAATGTIKFGNTIALFYCEQVTVKTLILAKVITEAWLAGKKLKGFIQYLQGV